MNNERKIEISGDLAYCTIDEDDLQANLLAYAGPIAGHILRLESLLVAEMEARCKVENALIDRIEKLEEDLARERKTPAFEPPSRVQVGNTSIDTRPGLPISDVIELVRAINS